MKSNNLFDAMVREAEEEVGNNGWRNSSPNAVVLAVGGEIKRLVRRIDKPFWLIGASILSMLIWSIISSLLGIK